MKAAKAAPSAFGRPISWVGRGRSFRLKQSTLVGYIFLLPATALYVVFVVYPMIQGVRISLFRWDGFTAETWVGLDHYVDLIKDADSREMFSHSVVLIFFVSILPIGIALLITVALSARRMRGATAYRAILFLPQVLPAVAVGLVWRWMYAPDGPINTALGSVFGAEATRGWLGDFTWALPAVGMVGAWTAFGFVMVLLLAGVQKIPSELYDAVRVDGAGRVREFLTVTLPGLRSELGLAAMVTVIVAFRTFDLIFVTTSGGPGTATSVPALSIYRKSFSYGEVGAGAAIGVTLTVIIFVAMFALTRATQRDQA